MTRRLALLLVIGMALGWLSHDRWSPTVRHLRLALLDAHASSGDATAQLQAGIAYAHQGDAKSPVRAVTWFRNAAEQGHPDGQFRLAAAYYVGFGADKDPMLAYMWSSLAEQRASGTLRHDAMRLQTYAAAALAPEQLADAQRRAREWQAAFEKRKR